MAYIATVQPLVAEAMFWAAPRDLEEIIVFLMQQNGIQGAVLAVGRADEAPTLKAFGKSLDGHLMSTDAVLPLASLSKPITAAAIMKMVEDGSITLNDRLVDLLPWVGSTVDPRYAEITVRQLLQHSAGWEQLANFDVPGDDCSVVARAELKEPLDYNPGARHIYSNIGFCWLELIISARSGQDYESFVRDRILRPSGADGLVLADRVRGGGWGWSGSAADYFRFAAHMDGAGQDTKGVRLEDPPVDYGLGVMIMGTAASHWGWRPGKMFSLMAKTHDGWIAVALFNGHPSDPRGVGARSLQAIVASLIDR